MKHLRLFNENFNTNLVDTLLDKIHNNGMSSLTSDELNYLKKSPHLKLKKTNIQTRILLFILC